MMIKLRRERNLTGNYKRVYSLMRLTGLKWLCRRKRYNYIKLTPEVVAKNVLNRDFKANNTCKKWLTDVTEMKCSNEDKLYLRTILDLGDRSIVSYVIGRSNTNALVFETFYPIFHSAA